MAVLDASALLALLWREPGHEVVFTYCPGAYVSTVNLAEVYSKCDERGLDTAVVRSLLSSLQLSVVDFDDHQAMLTGQLRSRTRQAGLSLGDRACLALATARQGPVVTADRVWSALGLALKVIVIR